MAMSQNVASIGGIGRAMGVLYIVPRGGGRGGGRRGVSEGGKGRVEEKAEAKK